MSVEIVVTHAHLYAYEKKSSLNDFQQSNDPEGRTSSLEIASSRY